MLSPSQQRNRWPEHQSAGYLSKAASCSRATPTRPTQLCYSCITLSSQAAKSNFRNLPTIDHLGAFCRSKQHPLLHLLVLNVKAAEVYLMNLSLQPLVPVCCHMPLMNNIMGHGSAQPHIPTGLKCPDLSEHVHSWKPLQARSMQGLTVLGAFSFET